MKELLTRQRAMAQRLGATETKEIPGNITGLSAFYTFGTYTPTYLGNTTAGVTTYTIQQGAWVRIGALVVATGSVVWTAATGTGFAAFGLPFAAVNVANQNYSGSVRVDSVTFANGTPQIVVLPTAAAFLLLSPLTNAASAAVNVEAAGNIVFTVSYFIA